MSASAVEFRFRYMLQLIVFALGLFAPWNYVLHTDATGPNAHSWGILAVWMSKQRVMNIGAAFEFLLCLGIFFAVAAAALRTWGTAYLGTRSAEAGSMHAAIVEAGPYRFLRNPLYLGVMLHAVALALLMPRSGAIFSLALTALLQFRLILGEEAFLTTRLGSRYTAYNRLVPRLLPAFRGRVANSGQRPHWAQALVAELYTWAVAGSYAFAGWQFNASLLIRCVLVSIGVAIIARALIPTAGTAVAI